MTTGPQRDRQIEPVQPLGDNWAIRIDRDANGNAFVSGNNNQVTLVVYQSVSERREPEKSGPADFGPNPYLGLQAFHEVDADRFFGREHQIERLWKRLRELNDRPTAGQGPPRLLPILGPSGSGKSSLARAGLLPELVRQPIPGWRNPRVAVFTPGPRPLEALAGVLARIASRDPLPVAKTRELEQELQARNNAGRFDGLRRIADLLPDISSGPLVVLVDQFEEVYSLCEDLTERLAFIDNLLQAAGDASGHVSVVITLRTDFVSETQSHELLNRVICEQQVMVPALSEAELRDAITRPAERAGHPFDEATVALLTGQTSDRVGALPLLQFALTRIWDGLRHNVAPAKTLEQIGGVGGALAGEAQRIYEQLGDNQRLIAKRVFLGLVQLGEGTRDTRRRALVRNLVAAGEKSDEVEQVIDCFAGRNSRLITLSADEGTGPTAEVTHEALFDHWQQLHDWLAENRDDVRFQRRLEEQAQRWKEEQDKPDGQPAGLLWRPPELTLLRAFRQKPSAHMTELQEGFFKASDEAENDRLQRERDQNRRLRIWTWISSTAGVVAIVMAGFAMVSRNAAVTAHNDSIATQIESLQSATSAAVPSILATLKNEAALDEQVVPILREKLHAERNVYDQSRFRLGLLAVAGDETQFDPLLKSMLEDFPKFEEYLLLRDQLAQYPDRLGMTTLWSELSTQKEPRWSRYAGALAVFDRMNERWSRVGTDVAEQLVQQDPAALVQWIAVYDPVQTHVVPRLVEIFASREPGRQSLRPGASLALARYLEHEPIQRAELLIDHADSPQTFRPLVARLPRAPFGSRGRSFQTDENLARLKIVERIEEVLKETVTSYRERSRLEGSRPEDIELLRRRTNAAIILLFVDESDRFRPLLASHYDPTLATSLLHQLSQLGVEPERFYPILFVDGQPPSVQQALVLALGEYPPYPISDGELTTCANHLLARFQGDPDPGNHSAAEWALKQWSRDSRLERIAKQMEVTRQEWASAGSLPADDKRWYVNKSGQTLIVIEAPEALPARSGLDASEDGHWRFAIGATEVTNPEFRKCLKDEQYLKRMGLFHPDEIPATDGPLAVEVTWYQAAGYCNWLTEQELGPEAAASQLCYIPNADGKFAEGMRIHPEYQKRIGYRLPTEAEWEYACRGSAFANLRNTNLWENEWSLGNSEELLDKYAHYRKTSAGHTLEASRVGLLKPNGFGLFDMYGNVAEWCQDNRSKPNENGSVELVVTDATLRVLRGGSYSDPASEVRTRSRSERKPDDSRFSGFRVVKSLP